METTAIITTEQLLKHWQGHRQVTRKLIEKFPEQDLFNFTIGGMRPFSEMAMELLSIAVPSLKEFTSDTPGTYQHLEGISTKQQILDLWDKSTEEINQYWTQIKPERFQEMFNLFGMYNSTIMDSVFYFIENEVHHRGQGYVYLRALGIEPPFFWERD
ncbi:DinB family protein [Pseudopedobacter beijingensis]|uniref:DinB family protein n=1 Tax=Pseudopedobacter beijingensis TaxID=1207056 RepID=A0ABW4IER4_9SPHI